MVRFHEVKHYCNYIVISALALLNTATGVPPILFSIVRSLNVNIISSVSGNTARFFANYYIYFLCQMSRIFSILEFINSTNLDTRRHALQRPVQFRKH